MRGGLKRLVCVGGDKSVSEKVCVYGGLCYLSLMSENVYDNESEGKTMILFCFK